MEGCFAISILASRRADLYPAATVACIKSAETAYVTVFPIQLAAFLQTLIRKGKINDILWHPIYALSLSLA